MKLIADSSMPLLAALEKISPKSSKTTLRSWIKEGRVSIDKLPVKLASIEVKAGQTVEVRRKQEHLQDNLRILYADRDFVVIDKPAGMLSVSTRFETKKTAHAYLKEKYHNQKVYVVHRLDQDTSGVMLFAFSEQAYAHFKKLFEAHDIEREYIAVVTGRVKANRGRWQSYLYEDKNYVVHTTLDKKKGELAITDYTVLKRTPKWTILKLRLETGKKNQIRVHCSDAGHPVAGDNKYGSDSQFNPLYRLGLHALRLTITHPVTEKPMTFESPPPEEFTRVFARIDA